ncbi:MAG TPA: ABC transporter permease [Intrasporangium sp.]|uniref:ABC transporter permease n=1 Tax=Intrasporangium sp. TaxID=1925024 RepID=UPI002D784CC5|nr:ABC transporter permease [Intrasporangium sp.]HET7399513.1 ABC transporter permease [Intrasporangium sp.]
MLPYLVRRIASAISVVFAAIVASFALFFVAPTDPAGAVCGEARCTPDRYNDIKKSLGIDRPILVQLWEYLQGIVAGRDFASGGVIRNCAAPCLGYSYKNDRPVLEMVLDALPVTLTLVLGASVIFFTFGVLMGSMAARRRGSRADRLLVGSTLVLSSIPYYVVALLTFLYLVLQFQVLPRPSGATFFGDGPVKWFLNYLTPWLVLGLVNSTAYARYSRGSMIESLSEDYVRTARAKGLSERRVAFRHALRSAITPVVTIYGLDIAALIVGSIFTESIFGLNGLGNLVLRSFRDFDLPVIMATTIIGAVVLVTMNLAVDIVYSFLDPRVRLA